VIDLPPLNQPAKVEPHLQSFFERVAGPDPTQQPMPNDARHGSRMNRRLPFGELASSFPFGEIDALQSLIDKPNITIDVNGPIEPFRKQHQLVTSQLQLCKSHHPLPDPPNLPKNQNQNQARQPLNQQAAMRWAWLKSAIATPIAGALGRATQGALGRAPNVSPLSNVSFNTARGIRTAPVVAQRREL
jgi:hypothetical protein